MRAVVFTGKGGNEVVSVEERPDPVPGSDEVLVAVRYAALNPADVSQRQGNYPAPPGSPADIPGLEVSGVVAACGAGVRRFKEGDRVFGIVGGGGLADRVVAHDRHLVPVPENLDELEAAAAPEALITAHDAIVVQAGLRSGDLLLVNGANGGVGTAAVQIALVLGARVLASVRSAEARDQVAGLGVEVVAPDEAVARAKAEGGADVVLELVGAMNLPANFEALATKGRIMVVGTGAGADGEISLRALMSKRARLLGTVLRARPIEEKAAAVQAFAHEVVPHLVSGRIRALVDRTYPAADAAEAFDRLSGPGKFGKVLLDFSA